MSYGMNFEFYLYEVGDRVQTDEGMGVVVQDEREPRDGWERHHRFVKIELDTPASTGEKILHMSAWNFVFVCDLDDGPYAQDYTSKHPLSVEREKCNMDEDRAKGRTNPCKLLRRPDTEEFEQRFHYWSDKRVYGNFEY